MNRYPVINCTLLRLTIYAVSVVFGISCQSLTANSAESVTFGFLEIDSKPYKWKENNEYKGYFIDILDEISRRTELRFTLIPLPLKRVTSYVERGIIDGCFGYYKTVAREQFAYFLDVPLSTMILKLYVLKGHDFQFKDITDIYNKRIGVLREQFVSRDFDAAKDEDKISVLYADDYKMMIRQLFHGRVDCIIGVTEGLENNIKKLGLSEQIISLTQPISLNNTWILISKKSGAAKKMEVYGKMNRALNDMARENLLHKIAQKYGYKSLVVMGHDAEKK